MLDASLAVIEQANALTVRVPTDRKTAADLWDAIRAFRKQEEANKETVCRPLKTAWEQAKQPYDDFIKQCESAEKKMQAAMSAWDCEQDRKAREEQARIQAKIDAKNAKKIARAKESGRDLSEIVWKVAPVVPTPARSIETQAGTTQTRLTRKVYKPKDVRSLMAAFPDLFELSMPKFNALAKTGMLDGRADVEITEEYIYAQRG